MSALSVGGAAAGIGRRSTSSRVGLWVMDGLLLGLFMVSVGVFVGLIESPASPVHGWISSVVVRRAVVGAAMGLTLVVLVYSPLGARSGAHLNPAFTIAFWRLGRIGTVDAAGYVAAQFVLGLAGCAAAGVLVGPWFSGAPVRYAATAPGLPGGWGVAAAFGAELAMTFGMLMLALYASNTKRLASRTGWIMGLALALLITVASPISGTALNPARTLASAIPAGDFRAVWIYFVAPVLGMLAAAEVFVRVRRLPRVHCCKLNHSLRELCPYCGCDGPIEFGTHEGEVSTAASVRRAAV